MTYHSDTMCNTRKIVKDKKNRTLGEEKNKRVMCKKRDDFFFGGGRENMKRLKWREEFDNKEIGGGE